MLVACIVLVFLMLLALSVAAPSVARGLEREREVESQHRAEQYVRALRVFYRKNGHYPTSIDQLKMTNNQRYLRQEYVDPLTGKADWRIIHVGENKTKVKGLFGMDLPGLAGGLGAAAGLASPTNTSTGAFGSNTNSAFNNNNAGVGANGSNGVTGAGASGTGGGLNNGITSTDATQATGGGGGPIMGVGSNKSGEAMLVVNEQDRFENWEFLYDPRIEQLYAKGALNGGGLTSGSATGTGGALPSAPPGFGGPASATPPVVTTPPNPF